MEPRRERLLAPGRTRWAGRESQRGRIADVGAKLPFTYAKDVPVRATFDCLRRRGKKMRCENQSCRPADGYFHHEAQVEGGSI